MIKPIVKDTFFLSQPCEEATDADLQTMLDQLVEQALAG